jgi:hypothetical protein
MTIDPILKQVLALFSTGLFLACSSEPAPPDECGAGEVRFASGCSAGEGDYRYEPATRLDNDNVLYYGQGYEQLELPNPPKSGFRLMLTEAVLEPFEDRFYCHAWSLPPELKNRNIYTAKLYTTAGLHHANMFRVGYSDGKTPSGYPTCNAPANDLIKDNIFKLLKGQADSIEVPDVLFANSTQIVGGETLRFPDGYANVLRTDGEIVLDTHLFNPTDKPLKVEVAWDFYTAPDEATPNPVGASVYLWLDFMLPPAMASSRTATCEWGGGETVAVMPHIHQWATGYTAEFLDEQDNVTATPYDVAGGLPESWIQIYDPPIQTQNNPKVRFTCDWENSTDHPMCNGVGENEMCFLFSYVSPPSASRYGIVPSDVGPAEPPCWVIDPLHPEEFPSVSELLADAGPEVTARLQELDEQDPEGERGSTCPDVSPGCTPGSPQCSK